MVEIWSKYKLGCWNIPPNVLFSNLYQARWEGRPTRSSSRLGRTRPMSKHCTRSSRMKTGRTGSSGDTRPLLKRHCCPYLGCLPFVYIKTWIYVLGWSSLQLYSYRPPRMLASSVLLFVWLNSSTLVTMMHKYFAYSRKKTNQRFTKMQEKVKVIAKKISPFFIRKHQDFLEV